MTSAESTATTRATEAFGSVGAVRQATLAFELRGAPRGPSHLAEAHGEPLTESVTSYGVEQITRVRSGDGRCGRETRLPAVVESRDGDTR